MEFFNYYNLVLREILSSKRKPDDIGNVVSEIIEAGRLTEPFVSAGFENVPKGQLEMQICIFPSAIETLLNSFSNRIIRAEISYDPSNPCYLFGADMLQSIFGKATPPSNIGLERSAAIMDILGIKSDRFQDRYEGRKPASQKLERRLKIEYDYQRIRSGLQFDLYDLQIFFYLHKRTKNKPLRTLISDVDKNLYVWVNGLRYDDMLLRIKSGDNKISAKITYKIGRAHV